MLKLALLGLSLIGGSHGLKAAGHQLNISYCILLDSGRDKFINTDADVDCVIKALPSEGYDLTEGQTNTLEAMLAQRKETHPFSYYDIYK